MQFYVHDSQPTITKPDENFPSIFFYFPLFFLHFLERMAISAISYDTPSSVPFLRFIVQVNWYTLHFSSSFSLYFVSLLQVLQQPLRSKSYKQQQPSLPTLLSNPSHLSSLNNHFLFSLFLPYSLFLNLFFIPSLP